MTVLYDSKVHDKDDIEEIYTLISESKVWKNILQPYIDIFVLMIPYFGCSNL
jgi:hypothetical protein